LLNEVKHLLDLQRDASLPAVEARRTAPIDLLRPARRVGNDKTIVNQKFTKLTPAEI
jgi:hypothetical protein